MAVDANAQLRQQEHICLHKDALEHICPWTGLRRFALHAMGKDQSLGSIHVIAFSVGRDAQKSSMSIHFERMHGLVRPYLHGSSVGLTRSRMSPGS